MKIASEWERRVEGGRLMFERASVALFLLGEAGLGENCKCERVSRGGSSKRASVPLGASLTLHFPTPYRLPSIFSFLFSGLAITPQEYRMPFPVWEAGWSHFGFLPILFEFQFFASTVIWRMMMKTSNESLSLISRHFCKTSKTFPHTLWSSQPCL